MISARYCLLRFAVLVSLSTILLCGCGGGDDPEADGGSNRSLTISGNPSTSALQGTSYSFTPSASDADGNALTFSVANLPAWATFNRATGRISGTPSSADVGTYGNITISVSNGAATASLSSFSIQVVGTATGSATLIWTPPTHNTDGTPLSNLTGYRVHWGTSPADYSNSVTINNSGLSSYVVEQLTPATWYFAVTALNSAGIESSFSNVATKVVR